MYSPQTSSRSSISGKRSANISFSSSRRSGSVFGSAKKSLYTPGFPYLRKESLNRSLQTSHVIEQTAQHTVELFGTALPVLVTEALTLTERGTVVSVKISESGWAWLVCGRRLFVWRYKQHSGSRSVVTQCRELNLPPSDLAHRADLVCILMTKDSHLPSAIAVSPEGIVRYWPNIAHEGSSIETAADLQGQECFSLINIQPLGCLLATTTCSLVLLSPDVTDGQNNISCRTLKTPQGVLAGLGKRVSSFIFGAVPNQSMELKHLVQVVAENGEEEEEKYVYVLSRNTLQKWSLDIQLPDKLLFESDIERLMKEGFFQALWNRDSTHLHQLKAWAIDMQLTKNGVLLLMVGLNPQVSQQVYYAFGKIDTTRGNCVVGFSTFCVIKPTEVYTESEEEKILNYKFVLPQLGSQLAYVYNQHKVKCVSVVTSNEEPDVLEFSNHGDKILGAGSCDGICLFFSNKYGLLSLQPIGATATKISQLNQSIPAELSMKESEVEELCVSDEKTDKLKAALNLYFRNDLAKSQAIIDEMFPPSPLPAVETDSYLDVTVALVSQMLIDDYPASDPRWAESIPAETFGSSSTSLILLHQLQDKMRAHELLITFFKGIGLWERLSTVTVRETPMQTTMLLCEHAEKLIAAMSLRNLHSQYGKLLGDAIQLVLQQRGKCASEKLTHLDVFYREVSLVDSIFPALVTQDQISSDISSTEILDIITAINDIFLTVLKEVCQYRVNKASVYESSGNSAQYIPWTATSGGNGMRVILMKQHSLTAEHAVPLAEDTQSRGAIYQQLLDIADIILDGYKCQLKSLDKHTERYETVEQKYTQDRHKLILPLLKMGQYERAASLAEKYCDFGILVQLCEDTNNQEKLQRYMHQFVDQGFSDFAFKWYLDKGKRGKLFSQLGSHSDDLAKFLQGHNTLSWLHHVTTGHFSSAQKILMALASEEVHYLSKKKTFLSLSKLASLTSDESFETVDATVEDLNSQLDLVLYQETLPGCVLEAYGIDPDTMRVLTPEELIKMYISEDNTSANEYDFKKALDLLEFMKKPPGDEEVEALRLQIWSQAILRDSWEDLDTDNPLEAIKDTIFFRTIELAFTQGVKLQEFLPPVEDLINEPELSFYAANPSFSYLIQAGYEHLNRLIH
ncbi:nuclear pore complex protein Nup133 isoform X1 [Tachypleus tridentatus]|uniref:nuclear pore complex protein Nup133 isoform X1 n=1 Tax=Tachypleus tridentatus TaxID=6853 RepID=UPI003FD475B3